MLIIIIMVTSAISTDYSDLTPVKYVTRYNWKITWKCLRSMKLVHSAFFRLRPANIDIYSHLHWYIIGLFFYVFRLFIRYVLCSGLIFTFEWSQCNGFVWKLKEFVNRRWNLEISECIKEIFNVIWISCPRSKKWDNFPYCKGLQRLWIRCFIFIKTACGHLNG